MLHTPTIGERAYSAGGKGLSGSGEGAKAIYPVGIPGPNMAGPLDCGSPVAGAGAVSGPRYPRRADNAVSFTY